MWQSQKILAIIPARGGSKGVPGKNLRLLKGESLLSRTIHSAQQSRYIDRLIVSSDDQAIIQAAKKANCEVPFVRPKHLAGDETPGIDPILHALTELPPYDYVVVLQVTSPLRTQQTIDDCIDFALSAQANVCVSVTESTVSPHWIFEIKADHTMQSIIQGNMPVRRQDASSTYHLNGAIYIANCCWLQKHKRFITDETLAYVMPMQQSLDIDTEWDLSLADFYLSLSAS